MSAKRYQPLFEDISNTEITPLAKSLRERLQRSDAMRDGLGVAATLKQPEAHEMRHSTHAAEVPATSRQPPPSRPREVDELEPLANLFAPPPSTSASSKPSRISKQLVIETIERHPWWLGILAFVTVLSLAVNAVCFLALRSVHQQLQAARSRTVTGQVVTAGGGAVQLESPACVAESSQTIAGAERDRLLLEAVRQHEMGQRGESLSTFRRYVQQACDAATLQTVAILERELLPPKKERAR